MVASCGWLTQLMVWVDGLHFRGCPIPMWTRQTAHHSSLTTSQLSCFPIARMLWCQNLQWAMQIEGMSIFLLAEKLLHRVAKMLVSSLFLNIYNFKLPRLKISLAPTALEGKKKDSNSHMLLVHSNVPLPQQVLSHASNVLLISPSIKTFSSPLSNILCHYFS